MTFDHTNELKKKIESIEVRTQNKKHKNEEEMKRKFNDFSMKMEDNQDKVMRIEKIHECIKEKKLDDYSERQSLIEIMQ